MIIFYIILLGSLVSVGLLFELATIPFIKDRERRSKEFAAIIKRALVLALIMLLCIVILFFMF